VISSWARKSNNNKKQHQGQSINEGKTSGIPILDKAYDVSNSTELMKFSKFPNISTNLMLFILSSKTRKTIQGVLRECFNRTVEFIGISENFHLHHLVHIFFNTFNKIEGDTK
jgi:hypothetical protein